MGGKIMTKDYIRCHRARIKFVSFKFCNLMKITVYSVTRFYEKNVRQKRPTQYNILYL